MDNKPFGHSPLPPDLLSPSSPPKQHSHFAHTPLTSDHVNQHSSAEKSMPAWVIIIIVLVISGAAVAGILYYQGRNTPQPLQPQLVVPTPTSNPEEVSNDDSVNTIDKEINDTRVDEFATDSANLEKDISDL